MNFALMSGAVACAAAVSSFAGAQPVVNAPITVPFDGTTVSLAFISASAAYTGELSFLGGGTALQVTQLAADTGEPGLGQQTFVNHQALDGDSITLEGTYNAGDVLHFGYRVVQPVEALDVLRTDQTETASHFSWDAQAGILHVEDLRPGHPWYDADYNDIIVQVTFSTVPGPATALIMIPAALGLRGRRRPGA